MTSLAPEALANACAMMLRLDPPPSEGEIDETLVPIAAAYQCPPDVIAATRQILHARFSIRMDLGQTLTSEEEHAPWLSARRGSIDPFYWRRYFQYLVRRGWPPLVAGRLDQTTDEILDLLGNPAETRRWRRRGLVMGDVQSGKTASYAALICKAADAGYRMIILLTGTLENVRRQTQERLDEAFIGFDSRNWLVVKQSRQKRHVGVGLIDKSRDGVVFTSRDSDFRSAAVTALNISLSAINEPVLVVAKKNKGVLERLASWLRAHNQDQSGRIDLPLLMIDDEADNASINTKQNPGETTAINRAIRDLLQLFTRSSYVGFTATPFANIFIDPASTDAMIGDDLFPSDFIHVLEAPTNYIGMHRLFQPVDADAAGEPRTPDDPVRTINDADEWLPARHAREDAPGPLPRSLQTAIECFLLSCAVRDLRANKGIPGRGGGIHRSMLVNVSRFTSVQNRVSDILHVELEEIRQAVRLYGRLPPDQAARQSCRIASLEMTFRSEYAGCGLGWDEVLHILLDAIGPVNVQPVNQSTGAKSLDYGVANGPPGVRVIAVGGNSLSRGLTLEGLSCSYFTRNVGAYDTLLQMGRWFGYRDGYDTLCRIWLTEEAEGWYRHVADATAELKRDFGRMKRQQATPKEFGLRVRTHPGTLLITARNKMATGMTVNDVWDVSLTGRMVESPTLYSDRRRNGDNLQLVSRYLGAATHAACGPSPSPHGAALLWTSVPATIVAELLQNALIHPENHDFQGDSIAEFLRKAQADGDPTLLTWTIALPTDGKAKTEDGRPAEVTLEAAPGETIIAARRKVKENLEDGSVRVSGKSARVGGFSDLRHAFSVDDWANLTGGRRIGEDEVRENMKGPLLVVYLIRGHQVAPDKTETPFRNGMILPAFGIHFPGKSEKDQSRRVVQYRLTRVAQRELLAIADDDDDAASDDDRDN
ncbi:Z1 domain-containing protein [Limobrevibacterium gyesilva]|uniref:Z1 domain-containing protein n=1 Tax=Limobrevibacterium gyesilva TaxID=2991712 RepID=A0AA42CFK7_9PROT|nr:Z1 domain-containing protein [Limobrevibacterium gyesilva]MCW3476749.1 Z1 domain-containing protein [Limobrevibacterium gyesilva]